MVLVDSSVWIEALRRSGRVEVKLALEGLLDVYEAKLCDPVRLEVLGGARASERTPLSNAFSILPCRSCAPEDWRQALNLSWRLRDQGFNAPWMDVLIATLALRDGDKIYSIDAHFESISRITGLVLYQPGYGGSFQP